MKNAHDKENFIIAALKNSEDLDAKLNEAGKLLMVVASLKLYEILQENNLIANGDNGEVRMFSMLLYGRESSRNPKELVMDNLDKIGNTISLDQVKLGLNKLKILILTIYINWVSDWSKLIRNKFKRNYQSSPTSFIRHARIYPSVSRLEVQCLA